jgi:hypothetical protein
MGDGGPAVVVIGEDEEPIAVFTDMAARLKEALKMTDALQKRQEVIDTNLGEAGNRLLDVCVMPEVPTAEDARHAVREAEKVLTLTEKSQEANKSSELSRIRDLLTGVVTQLDAMEQAQSACYICLKVNPNPRAVMVRCGHFVCDECPPKMRQDATDNYRALICGLCKRNIHDFVITRV